MNDSSHENEFAVIQYEYFFTEIKNKSQSEQPATCPICQAVIRQSRNLRRHLELRHFKKPGMKKERVKKNKQGIIDVDTDKTSSVFLMFFLSQYY